MRFVSHDKLAIFDAPDNLPLVICYYLPVRGNINAAPLDLARSVLDLHWSTHEVNRAGIGCAAGLAWCATWRAAGLAAGLAVSHCVSAPHCVFRHSIAQGSTAQHSQTIRVV